MLIQRVCAPVLCAGLVLFCATVAEASLKLRLTDSATAISVEITDGEFDGGGDDDGASGVAGLLTFSGSIGTFDVVFELASSKPITGSAANPLLSLISSVSSIAPAVASTLTIELTDTDFGPSLNPLSFVSILNSALSVTQSTTLDTYIDLGNGEFATTTLLSSLGPASGVFNLSDFASAATDASYSLTMVATVTHPAGGATSNWDASLSAVPEPVAFVVWSGLMGVAALAVARKRQRADRS